jgi:hypothetical protein
MKKTMMSIVLLGVTVVIFGWVCAATAAGDLIIEGTIISIDAEAGVLEVREESGQVHTLKTSEEMRAKDLKEGQTFIFKCNQDRVIQSVVQKG